MMVLPSLQWSRTHATQRRRSHHQRARNVATAHAPQSSVTTVPADRIGVTPLPQTMLGLMAPL